MRQKRRGRTGGGGKGEKEVKSENKRRGAEGVGEKMVGKEKRSRESEDEGGDSVSFPP